MPSFSELLSERMESEGFSSRGLSRQANRLADEVSGWKALNSDGDGVENWVRPRRSWGKRSIRPRYWLQLAAIAQVLEFGEEQAQEFFGAAGWSLDGLRVKSSPDQRWLLDFGQPPLLERGLDSKSIGTELVATGGTMVPYREKERLPARISLVLQRSRPRRLSVVVAAVTLVVIGLIAGLSLANRQEQSTEAVEAPDGEPEIAAPLAQSQPEPSSSKLNPSPPLPLETVGRSCLIELNIQPNDTEYSRGVLPDECPEMSIWNQYQGYEGGDLVSWDEGVAQCWAGPPLVRLWVGFELADSSRGWLPLMPETSSGMFREDSPVIAELRSAPNVSAPSIGIFSYEDLDARAFAVQLDLPEWLDLTLASEQGDYHLGGCWQQADRDGARGIHFFWPPGVNP